MQAVHRSEPVQEEQEQYSLAQCWRFLSGTRSISALDTSKDSTTNIVKKPYLGGPFKIAGIMILRH